MELSAKALTFQAQNQKKYLKLTNNHSTRLIFKIRVNNTAYFTISPGRGLLPPSQTINIQITFAKDVPCSAKVQVLHAVIPDDHEDSFERIWSQIDRHLFREDYVMLTGQGVKVEKEELEEQPESRRRIQSFNSIVEGNNASSNSVRTVLFKPTDSPIYEHEHEHQQHDLRRSKSQVSSSLVRRSQKPNPESRPRQSQLNNRSTEEIFSTIEVPSIESGEGGICSKMTRSHPVRLKNLQKELLEEKEQNKLLKEKLEERERKLSYYKEESQKQVNESFRQQNQGFQLNCMNTYLLMVICIILGFVIARGPSQQL